MVIAKSICFHLNRMVRVIITLSFRFVSGLIPV